MSNIEEDMKRVLTLYQLRKKQAEECNKALKRAELALEMSYTYEKAPEEYAKYYSWSLEPDDRVFLDGHDGRVIHTNRSMYEIKGEEYNAEVWGDRIVGRRGRSIEEAVGRLVMECSYLFNISIIK